LFQSSFHVYLPFATVVFDRVVILVVVAVDRKRPRENTLMNLINRRTYVTKPPGFTVRKPMDKSNA